MSTPGKPQITVGLAAYYGFMQTAHGTSLESCEAVWNEYSGADFKASWEAAAKEAIKLHESQQNQAKVSR